MTLPTDPVIIQGALAGITLLTVATFVKVWAMDKKMAEAMPLLAHPDVGLMARMVRVEHQGKRHSDALRAADLLRDD